ncbi:MAG: hypothetical protein ACLVKR_04415 [Lachnospiraceae bacterium]
MKLRGEVLPVFLVSEVILVIICAAGYFSGGAILAIMFILSIFTSGLADHIFLCMTKKDRLKKYKNFTAFQDKKRICILNSTQIDVVETLRAMLSSSYSCAVFEILRLWRFSVKSLPQRTFAYSLQEFTAQKIRRNFFSQLIPIS